MPAPPMLRLCLTLLGIGRRPTTTSAGRPRRTRPAEGPAERRAIPLSAHLRGRRISMKMSSCRAVLERGSVTQHRPQHVDPPPRQSYESLSMLLAFGPLAIVEDPGLRRAA